MSEHEEMQKHYGTGDYIRTVEAAEDAEHIVVHYLLDQISELLDDLSEYVSPGDEKIDPENYAALKRLLAVEREAIDLLYRDHFEPGYQIKIPEEIFTRAGQWNNWVLPAEELKLVKERIEAFNAGNIYLVNYFEVPVDGECYFANHQEIAEHLAGVFMLTRSDNCATAEQTTPASAAEHGRD